MEGHAKLSVTANSQSKQMEFVLINSSIDFLLGFSWLTKFKPHINWKVATLDKKFWLTVHNIYHGPSNATASSSQVVKLATSVYELAHNAQVQVLCRKSQAWGPCPRKEGDVTFQPLAPLGCSAIHVEAILDLEDLQDIPSQAEITYWTHGEEYEDNNDETTVCRMLDLPEDAKELEDAEEDAKDLKDA